MEFPHTIYKDGKLDAKGRRRIENVKELLLAYEDGYWPYWCEKEDVLSLPEVENAINAEKQIEKELSVLERFDVIKKKPVEKPVEALSKEADKYKYETGKSSVWESGPHKGKLTKEFKEWRENANQ